MTLDLNSEARGARRVPSPVLHRGLWSRRSYMLDAGLTPFPARVQTLGQPGPHNRRHADYWSPDAHKESGPKSELWGRSREAQRVPGGVHGEGAGRPRGFPVGSMGKEQGGPEGSRWGPCPATYRGDLPPAPPSHGNYHGFSEAPWDRMAASAGWDHAIASGRRGFCSLGHDSSSASWDRATASSCGFRSLRPHRHGFCLLQGRRGFCRGPEGSAVSASIEVRTLAASLAIG
ncbi:uncharacterized protein LOC100386657 [Callithrix jacchus]